MQRCLALIILFENNPNGTDADYIKDSIHQYRNLSSSAFHRSFERDKDVLRSMGFVINYINDKWSLESGYKLTGTGDMKVETKKRDFRRVLASCMVSPALYADYLYFKSITLRLYDLAVKLVTLTLILLSWQIYKGYQRGGVTRTDTHGSTSENYGHCWRFRD